MAKKEFEVALILSAQDKASRVVAETMAKSQKSIASLSKMGDKAFAVGRVTGAVGLATAASLGVFVNAAEESEIATRRLEQTFRTMGETDNRAAVAAAAYASELQTKIGVEDEEIMMVQSKIATFKKASDETARMSGIFDRATQSAFDLAAGGFGEASSNAVMLGKALQNPALGAAALSKAGALNKADIPLIKQIQATKGLGAAQEYVLKAVERQVKGQAANTATSASKMRIQFGEISETLGKSLLPSVSKAMAEVGKIANRFNNWSQKNPELTSSIMKGAAALAILSLGVSAASFVFGGLFKILALGRSFFTALKAAQLAYNIATAAGAGVTGGMTAAMTALNLAFLANPITWVVIGIVALIAAGYLLIKNWDKVKAFFQFLWYTIKFAFSKFLDFVKNWGVLLLGPVGLIIKYWDKIPGWFAAIWTKVKTWFTSALDWYLSLPKKFLNIGSDIVMGIWNGIKAKAAALFDFVKGIGSKIASTFKNVLGIASPSKVFMDYGVNITQGAQKGIEKGSPNLVGATNKMGKSVSPNPIGGSRSGGGSGITVHFAPVISGAGGGDIASEIKKLIPQLVREIESSMARKQRLAY
jgi:hypothetical protein